MTQETPEVDDETTEETSGVDDETSKTEAELDNIDDKKSVEHTSGVMNLHRQSRTDYNSKNYNDNMFNITEKYTR